MTNSIASPTDVQSAGALLTAPLGGANDGQLNAAIALARLHIITLLKGGELEYRRIKGYNNPKTADFRTSEAMFALSFLPNVLGDAQLEQTGYKTQSTIGRAVTTFGNPVDVTAIADFWATQALIPIEKYLDTAYRDDKGNAHGIQAGSIAAISI